MKPFQDLEAILVTLSGNESNDRINQILGHAIGAVVDLSQIPATVSVETELMKKHINSIVSRIGESVLINPVKVRDTALSTAMGRLHLFFPQVNEDNLVFRAFDTLTSVQYLQLRALFLGKYWDHFKAPSIKVIGASQEIDLTVSLEGKE